MQITLDAATMPADYAITSPFDAFLIIAFVNTLVYIPQQAEGAAFSRRLMLPCCRAAITLRLRYRAISAMPLMHLPPLFDYLPLRRHAITLDTRHGAFYRR